MSEPVPIRPLEEWENECNEETLHDMFLKEEDATIQGLLEVLYSAWLKRHILSDE